MQYYVATIVGVGGLESAGRSRRSGVGGLESAAQDEEEVQDRRWQGPNVE